MLHTITYALPRCLARSTSTRTILLTHSTPQLVLAHPRSRRGYVAASPRRGQTEKEDLERQGKKPSVGTGLFGGLFRRLLNWPVQSAAEQSSPNARVEENNPTRKKVSKQSSLTEDPDSKSTSNLLSLKAKGRRHRASLRAAAAAAPATGKSSRRPSSPKHASSRNPTANDFQPGALTSSELADILDRSPRVYTTESGFQAERILTKSLVPEKVKVELGIQMYRDLRRLRSNITDGGNRGEINAKSNDAIVRHTARMLWSALEVIGIDPQNGASVQIWKHAREQRSLQQGASIAEEIQRPVISEEQPELKDAPDDLVHESAHEDNPPDEPEHLRPDEPEDVLPLPSASPILEGKGKHASSHLAEGIQGTVRIGGMDMDIVRHFELSGKQIQIHKVEPIRQAKVAKLARGLDRVLFNPPVYFLRDPHSLVYNFSPSLEVIPRPEDFAFDRLPQYVTASKDPELLELARKSECKFYGSTSTLTTALSQIYFMISGNRPVDITQLSSAFANESTSFTAGATLPAKLTVRIQPDGRYAIDNDKSEEAEEENILSDLGRVMEKLLTSEEKDTQRFLKSSPDSGVSNAERNEREAYYYSKGSTLLMRSQLDCHDDRLPGTGTFDIKTRAAITVRHDRTNHLESSSYDIASTTGLYESFERELYDMSRSAALKYSLQVRIGNMDGIFVAYHNSKRILGFQYIPLREMNRILHGTDEMGEQAFKLSVSIFEHILQEATGCFPGKTISLILEHQSKFDELAVYIQPEDSVAVDGIEGVPTVALTVRTIGRLNKKAIYGGGVDFKSSEFPLESVHWTLDCDVIKSPMTQEGVTFARKGRDAARQRHLNMQTLYAPSGKTAKDLNIASKGAQQKNVKASATEATKTPRGMPTAELLSDIMNKSAEAVAPRRITWRDPGAMVKRLRSLALASGKRYEDRVKGAKGKKAVVWRPQAGR